MLLAVGAEAGAGATTWLRAGVGGAAPAGVNLEVVTLLLLLQLLPTMLEIRTSILHDGNTLK